MENKLFSRNGFVLLDGAIGTMLQAAGLAPGERPESFCYTAPEKVVALHRAYLDAGADIICANTFGANPKKLAGSGWELEDVIGRAIALARQARAQSGKEKALVALDVGPLGEMLEPGGTLAFEEAYTLFGEVMRAGETAGADVVMIATMTDLYEAKAALLAAKEQTGLPVMVSMSFEKTGRSFAGVPVEAMALTLAPLGPAAIGINCSLGPADSMPLAKRLCDVAEVPVFVKPNAGLPDPSTGRYSLFSQKFCSQMLPCLDMGVAAVGGCCGTTPETIARLADIFGGKAVAHRAPQQVSRVCSGTRVVEIDRVCPIGERINPTGKKRLQEALRAGDIGHIQSLAAAQAAAGAAILDVNVGAPGVDEVDMLPKAVKAVQAVCDLPLQLDSANPEALKAALRVYNGKAIVNSTSGEKEKLEAVLPLCKKYGAAVVGLALDENGIPEKAQARYAVAEKILASATQYGIPKQDVYIDCLTLAASAGQGPADETLRALRLVKEKLGLKTVLGVSNVSFGLPARGLVNRTFLSMALFAGLDLPILNPDAEDMMDTVAAFEMLHGRDEGAKGFIVQMEGREADSGSAPAKTGTGAKKEAAATPAALPLDAAIEQGLKAQAAATAKEQLAQGKEGLAMVNEYLMPALDRVGQGFETGRVFLPQLLAAATAAQAAFEVIRASYQGAGSDAGPPIVVATVKGDVHDIGKNIVKVLLENYGFRVIDLGRDVPPEKVVEAAKKNGVKLVGLSALMTTTLPAMQATIKALRAEGLPCKVMVGGAVLTESYAKEIGADYYVKDAKASVDVARKLHNV